MGRKEIFQAMRIVPEDPGMHVEIRQAMLDMDNAVVVVKPECIVPKDVKNRWIGGRI